MKQIALLSLFVLAGILLIKGNNPFSTTGKGLELVEVETEPATVEVIVEEPEPTPQIDQELAERLVDEALASFRKDLDRAEKAFENRVNSAFNRARGELLPRLQALVNDKIGRYSLFKQAVRMAADIVDRGEDRSGKWVRENFEKPLRPILEELSEQISIARHQWVQDRQAALAALETRFLKDIPIELEETAQSSHLVGGSVLAGASQKGNRAAASLGVTALATSVFLKSDIADLKKTPNVLKTLRAKSAAKLHNILSSKRFQKIIGKRLAPIAKRYAKKIAASGIMVVADGPLPFGDIVAVVVTGASSIWAVYEVWTLGSGARAEMMEDAKSNFEKLGQELRAEVLEPVRRDRQNLVAGVNELRGSLLSGLAEL